MRITDLGFKLPPYEEQIIHIEMGETQGAQYDWLNATLMDYVSTGWDSSAEERSVAQKLLGVWLQNFLGRVNSGFRPETVMYSVNKQVKLPVPMHEDDLLESTGFGLEDGPLLVADFLQQVEPGTIRQDDVVLTPDEFGDYALHLEPMVPDGALLPKEEWLVETCLQKHAAGRKVLLYVRQTGTRDIQPRLREILEEVGLRAVVLPDSVTPKRREAWIRKQEAGGSGDFTAELAARILDGEDLNSDGITGLLKQTILDEDEEPLWKALDEEEEAFDDTESFDEFVDTWAMWQEYQKDYVTRCLERAARRRRRKFVPEQQLSLVVDEAKGRPVLHP